MKSSTRLVIVALVLGGFQSLFAQPASPDQIEAARQYLRSGRFGNPRSSSPAVRTNSLRNPGSSMRYGTRPNAVPAGPPGSEALRPDVLSPDQERNSRRMLSDMRSLKPTNTYPASAVVAPLTPAPIIPAPTPAPVDPVVQAPAVIPTPAPTPLPEPVAPPVTTPALQPPVVSAPAATALSGFPENKEAEALRLLEEYKQRGNPDQAEANRVQDAIKAAKNAQDTRARTAKTQEETERMKEIARIEAEVLRAKAQREGTTESALPRVTPPPATIPEPVAPAATVPSIAAPAPTIPPPATIPTPATIPIPSSIPSPATPSAPVATIPTPAAVPPPAIIPEPPAAASIPPVATPPPVYDPPASLVPATRTPSPATVVPAPAYRVGAPQSRPTLTPDMELKARELLNQQMATISPPSVPPDLTTPARAATPRAATVPPNDESARRAAAEARAKKETLEWERQRQLATPSATSVTPTPGASPSAAAPVAPLSSPLSTAKQSRLEELGAAYKSDKITAAQYHAERARILAEP